MPELQRLVPAAGTPAHPMAGVAPAMAVMPGRRRAAATVGVEVVAPRAAAAHARAWADSIQARDSMFGRDSVISGFSHSGPSVLPERGGKSSTPRRCGIELLRPDAAARARRARRRRAAGDAAASCN
ncbi:MAG: hypothetical protein IPM15_01680 [Betaproteobacteria bacterium]|nr:hypothetical protein [Betaproteobacteria bacterium]